MTTLTLTLQYQSHHMTTVPERSYPVVSTRTRLQGAQNLGRHNAAV